MNYIQYMQKPYQPLSFIVGQGDLNGSKTDSQYILEKLGFEAPIDLEEEKQKRIEQRKKAAAREAKSKYGIVTTNDKIQSQTQETTQKAREEKTNSDAYETIRQEIENEGRPLIGQTNPITDMVGYLTPGYDVAMLADDASDAWRLGKAAWQYKQYPQAIGNFLKAPASLVLGAASLFPFTNGLIDAGLLVSKGLQNAGNKVVNRSFKDLTTEGVMEVMAPEILSQKKVDAGKAWQKFWQEYILPQRVGKRPFDAWHIDHVKNPTIETGKLSDVRAIKSDPQHVGQGTWWDIMPNQSQGYIGSHLPNADNIVIQMPGGTPQTQLLLDNTGQGNVGWWNYSMAPAEFDITGATKYFFDGEKWAVLPKHKEYILNGGIYKSGGSIHIKKKNKGKFTASAKAAGEGVQEHAHKVMNDPNATPLQKKRANFAIQAKKWHRKHQSGSKINYLDIFV